MSAIRAAYLERTRSSAGLYKKATNLMPGGTSRQASYWAPYPLTIKRGAGPHFWDLDGHEYLDLINNYTAMVHGHAYPPIVEATRKQISDGTGWAAANEPQNRLAELIVDRVPAIEQVRFTNSGSEAGVLAFTIARIVTGRSKLLMARWGYHGSALEFGIGFFGKEGPLTHLATYNDPADFVTVLGEHGDDIAAVFLEPVLGASGIICGEPDFLHEVRAAAHKVGALFVLDEVLTLRFAVGGCQGAIGTEDLVPEEITVAVSPRDDRVHRLTDDTDLIDPVMRPEVEYQSVKQVLANVGGVVCLQRPDGLDVAIHHGLTALGQILQIALDADAAATFDQAEGDVVTDAL